MKKLVLALFFVGLLSVTAYATDIDFEDLTAEANVSSSQTITVVLHEGEYNGPVISSGIMDFGTLIPDSYDPHLLTGSKGFCAIVTVFDNSGNPWKVKYDGGSLLHKVDGLTKLSDDAWTVIATGPNGETTYTGLDTARKTAAATAWDVYQTSTKSTDYFRLYFGISATPASMVGSKVPIVDTQKGGDYETTITLTLTE